MTPERFQKIKNVLDKRQPDLTIVMDNVHKPHNLAAIIRTCDAIGIGHIHGISKNQDKVGVNLKAASGSNCPSFTFAEPSCAKACAAAGPIIGVKIGAKKLP